MKRPHCPTFKEITMPIHKTIPMKAFLILVFLSGILLYPAFCQDKVQEVDAATVSAKETQAIQLLSPKKGKGVGISNKKVQKWWDHYKKNKARKMANGKERTRPDPVVLKWGSSMKKGTSYRVLVSLKEDFSHPLVYNTKEKSKKIYRLRRNTTYYWKVTAASGTGTVTSPVYSFYTKDCARTMKVGGVDNIRDLGGYMTEFGTRIRQGKVYRSANLNKTTKKGKRVLVNLLKIRTDLDLRRKGEGGAGKKSPVLKNYIHIHGKGYEKMWKTQKGKKTIVKEMKVFADESNYPVLFHCTYGRDRTGTLAFMLNGLLGVSKKDLYRDFELTFLSGKSGSKESGKKRMKRFDKVYKYMSGYRDRTKPLSYNIEAFLLDNGMQKDEIDTIRTIMLE